MALQAIFFVIQIFAFITTLQEYGKLKKVFPVRCISKMLLIDTEQLSKMQISLQVFCKDSIDRFRTSYR